MPSVNEVILKKSCSKIVHSYEFKCVQTIWSVLSYDATSRAVEEGML